MLSGEKFPTQLLHKCLLFFSKFQQDRHMIYVFSVVTQLKFIELMLCIIAPEICGNPNYTLLTNTCFSLIILF